jgi:hypothetical protein
MGRYGLSYEDEDFNPDPPVDEEDLFFYDDELRDVEYDEEV